MKRMIKYLALMLCLSAGHSVLSQSPTSRPVRVLFIGNSYVYYNELPQMTSKVAASYGEQLQVDSHSPGGYTLKHQAATKEALDKVKLGNWNYVVLQEQSEAPAAPMKDVEANTFPYAHFFDSLTKAHNPSSKTIFYMTWGRKNGSTNYCDKWPGVCTYQGMDSLLAQRYTMMAKANHAILSPVGAVWKYIRKYYPGIELYDADSSHPSEAGSYAAACTFATILFRKDPTEIKYNSKLDAIQAAQIRIATKLMVFDHLGEWYY